MIEIYSLDFIASILAVTAILILLLEWKRSGYRLFKMLLIVFFIITLIYSGLLFGEWSAILLPNERLEDISGALLPIIWMMVFYMLLEHVKINKLRESENNWRITFFSIGDALITLDTKGCVSRMNPVAEKLTGWKLDEAQGKKIDDVLRLRNPLISNFTIGNIISSRAYIILPDHAILISKTDEEYQISGSVSPIIDLKDEDNSGTGMILAFRDISESYRIQEKLIEEEERLKLIFEGAELGSWDIDLISGRIIFNKRWAEILGYAEDELNSMDNSWKRLTHEEDLPVLLSALNDHIVGKRGNFQVEHRMLTKDGEWKWTLTRGKVIQWNENGKPIRAAGIHRDITLRRQTQEKLHFQASLLDVVEKAVIVTDALGRITYWNPHSSAVYGWKAEEVDAKNILEVLNVGLSQEEQAAIFEKISKGGSYIREFDTYRKNGSVVTVLCTITPIYDVLKQITGIVSVLTDMTERKKILNELKLKNDEYAAINLELSESLKKIKIINTQLEKAKEKAEESDRLKTAFLANLSHEVRTPMNGILGFAELLKNGELKPATQQKYIDVIQQSGERMLNLIDDLIDISKIEAGAIDIKLDSVDIGLMMDHLYTFFKPSAEEKGLRLSYIAKEYDTIVTDLVKLEQIMTNLIKNAIKYTQEGSVSFGCDMIRDYYCFWVKDTGVGIHPDHQELIFDRFRKANTEYLGREEGSGLGLSISKAFIEMMGGKIWIESKPGKGSTFSFTLPMEKSAETLKEDKPKFQGNHKNITVLVAEDDDISYIYLAKVLDDHQMKVVRAVNGQEAVRIAGELPEINLILMDIKMPLMNGFDATLEIRKKFPLLPIIAQTAYVTDSERNKALISGFTDFISKPINREELMVKINKHIRQDS